MKQQNNLGKVIAQCFLCLLLFFLMDCTFCNDNAVFTPVGEERQHISGQYEYLEDPLGTFTFNQVLNGQVGQFKPMQEKNFGFRYKKILWIRFSIDFKNYKDSYWFLTQGFEHVGELSLFYPTEEGYQSKQMLESNPAGQRAFDVHNYLFRVPTPHKSPAIYYMRFNPQGHALSVDLSWFGNKGLIEFIHNSLLSLGLFFGGLLIMWLYNCILYVNLRDRDYLCYLYYLGSFIGIFIYLDGFGPLLIDSPKIYEPVFAVFAYGAIHGMTLFARSFLSLKLTVPRLDKILWVIQWILLCGGVASVFLPVGIPYPILNILIIFTGPLLVTAGVIRWYQGFRPARYYTAGWAIFIASLMIFSLRTIGVLPPSFLTNFAVQIASVCEAILFSMALAYRLNLIEKNAAKAKTAFLGMISHELNTPLQEIGSLIDLLTMKYAQNDQIFNRLRTAAEHLEIQVKDLTDYARLESGKLTFRNAVFNASEIVLEIVEGFRVAAEIKGLEIRTDIEANIIVSSDVFRFQQILKNIISNAIKYTQNGYVEVGMRCSYHPMVLTVSVQDSGDGIKAEDIPSLFEPFTQIDQSSTRRHDGIGMGLAVVQKLLSIFGGSIKVDSVPGKGSTFKVAIPVGDGMSGNPELDEPIADSTSDRRILLVDDNHEVRNTLKEVLLSMRYSCDTAEGGVAAISLANDRKYAAILLDINMPDLDGFEVAARIRSGRGRNRDIPIIWISASSPEDLLPDQKKLFSYFLAKPVRSNKLDKMLRQIGVTPI